MNDKIKINLQIADMNYPLTIDREDEEMVREATKRIYQKLNMYRSHYPTLDLKRVLGMVAYDFSRKALELEKKNDTAPYKEKIKELTEVLEHSLKGE